MLGIKVTDSQIIDGETVITERDSNLVETAVAVPTFAVIGCVAAPFLAVGGIINWFTETPKVAPTPPAAPSLPTEADIRYQQYIDNFADLEMRIDALRQLTPSNGIVAVIAKDYESSTSTWHYVVTEDGTLVRRRPWDGAAVVFDDIEDMRSDFFRYHYRYGFRLES